MITKIDSPEDIRQILILNEKHNRKLFEKYDPYTGEGSPIPREKLWIDNREFILIPTYLFETAFCQDVAAAGTLTKFSTQQDAPCDRYYDFLNEQRIKYDFEYWCVTCVKIKDKKSGGITPFILRRPQLKLLKVLVADLFANKPVRIILLKARQWGGSTLVQLFEAWIQLFHRTNWNSCIVAHQKDQARNVRAMYSRMAQHHPKDVFPVCFQNFEGSQSNRQLKGRGAVISIGSVQNPDALRSDDLKLAHYTEVGLWQDTPKRKAADIIQSTVGSIPDDPFTCIVLESTAKGVGNYFYNTWVEAEKGDNEYVPIFVAWWEIDIYHRPFHNEQEKLDFIHSLTNDEIYRFNLGATLEGLHWYRRKRRTMPSDWRMRCEYPSTALEAFATSGRNVHNPADIQHMMQQTCEPRFCGELQAAAAYGEAAIDNSLLFVPRENGTLWLWQMPDKIKRIENRYVVSMDIGGRSDSADWTVISVIDRYMMLFGGDEECIGTYRFHLDQDLAVWKAVQLARFFNDALLVVEFNSLDTKTTEGDHSFTILDQIVKIYDNIYYRDDPTKILEGLPPHYGFHTNKATKRDLITHMQRLLRDQLYTEYDKRALDEALVYEQKANSDVFGAVDGMHDDIYMSRAIGLKVSSTINPPKELPQKEKLRPIKDGVRTQASF